MNLQRLLKRLESDDRGTRRKTIRHLAKSGEEEAINTLMNISKGRVLRTKKRGPWLLFPFLIPHYYELNDQLDCFEALAGMAEKDSKVFNFLKTSLTYGIHNDTDYSEDDEHNHCFFYRKEYEPFMPAVLSFSVVCSMRGHGIDNYKSGSWSIDSESIPYLRLFEQAWRVVLPIKQKLKLKGDDVFLISRYLKIQDDLFRK